VRAALARLAGRERLPESEPWLVALLADPEPDVLLEALRVLGARGYGLDRETCLRLLHSPLTAVRAELADAIVSGGDRDLLQAVVAE
jgi:hypothetical protein